MTTFFDTTMQCALCGQTVHVRLIASTIAFGPSDLDTRPPPLARTTLAYDMMCCPGCGYCAPKIEKAPPQAAAIVASTAYQETRHHTTLPELARSFLCWSQIAEATHAYDKAGWAALKAAWACDDACATEEAIQCRERAAHLFQLAQAHKQPFAADAASEYAILADVWRRSRHFQKAIDAAEEGLRHTPSSLVKQVLQFQITLARQQDAALYTTANLPPASNAPPTPAEHN